VQNVVQLSQREPGRAAGNDQGQAVHHGAFVDAAQAVSVRTARSTRAVRNSAAPTVRRR
jgi:hypothetical protein